MGLNTKAGIRRLEYFGWSLLVAIVFGLPCTWLEGENAPSKLMAYLLVYGLYGFFTGILIEKRAKNIGFSFKESLGYPYGSDGIRPVAGFIIVLFLLLGVAIWADVTGQDFNSSFLIPVAALLLVASISAIPIGLYLLFAPQNHKQSFSTRNERKKLEKELRDIKEADKIEKLKQEIEDLKREKNSNHSSQ